MTTKRLEYYRSILLERKAFVLETIERLREFSPVQEEDNELNKKYSDNFAEQGADSIGKEEFFLFISRELIYLNRIKNALTLIDQGIYGKCKSCGKAISFERLKAVPTADTCVQCKKSLVVKRNLN